MSTMKKVIGLILSLALLSVCALSSLAESTDSYKDANGQRPMGVILKLHNDGYRQVLEATEDPSYNTHYHWVLDGLHNVLEGNQTLTDYFNSCDDYDKAKTIVIFYLSINGGPPMEYIAQFMPVISDYMDLYVESLLLMTNKEGDAEAEANYREWLTEWSEIQTYDRNIDFKEYLQRLIAYWGNDEELPNVPVIIDGDLFGEDEIGKTLTDYLAYFSFLDEEDPTLIHILYNEGTVTRADYVSFLNAVYEFMYPEPAVTTTITSKVTGSINYLRDLTNIAKATNVTGVTNVTGLTGVTQYTGVTNVSVPSLF